MSISVVIPVYNEENSIRSALIKCNDILKRDFNDYEIIVVNDGSKDETGRILSEIEKEFSEIKVLDNLINLNQGVSIQRAFKVATKQYVLHNGIDLPLDPGDIKNLLESMDDCDLLILEREKYSGASNWRKFASTANITIRKILFPKLTKNLVDLNFVQVYKNEIIPIVLPLAKSPAFTTPEMIFRARHNNLKIKTIKVKYNARVKGSGSLGKLHDILWTFYDMIRFKFLIILGLDKHGITK